MTQLVEDNKVSLTSSSEVSPMTQEQSSPDQTQQQSGSVRGFLRALVRTVLTLAIIAGVIAAGWFLFQELQRSFGAVNGRMDSQAEQVAALQSQLNAQAGQLQDVRATVGGLDDNLAGNLQTLQQEVAQNKSDQEVALAGLSAQFDGLGEEVDGLAAGADEMAGSLATLGEGQSALQQDLITLNSDMDAQGGEFDALLAEFEAVQTNERALADQVAAFEVQLNTADPAGLRQSVAIFRIWQMVARARLRLAEHNLGLAAEDVQLAQAAAALLLEDAPQPLAEQLQPVNERLQMAADNLPDEPVTAANDLDIAWQELDGILEVVLGIAVEPTATPEP
jgi:chromosome segregation ATPase